MVVFVLMKSIKHEPQTVSDTNMLTYLCKLFHSLPKTSHRVLLHWSLQLEMNLTPPLHHYLLNPSDSRRTYVNKKSLLTTTQEYYLAIALMTLSVVSYA